MEERRLASRRRVEEDAESSVTRAAGGVDREQELAATKIQSRVRGKYARHHQATVGVDVALVAGCLSALFQSRRRICGPAGLVVQGRMEKGKCS